MRPNTSVDLLDLLSGAGLLSADIFGNPDVLITGISTHAQRVEPGQMFVAIAGTKTDSHLLISDAIARGAAAVLAERDIPAYPHTTMVRVPNTRRALGQVVQAYHGNPARNMTMVGITGTNGKTTTSSLVSAIMTHAGLRTGLIGTLGTFWNNNYVDDHITTPDAMTLARSLSRMVEDRVDLAVMEVSSHAIDQCRTSGIPFKAAALTSVSQDHLDYHGDYASYMAVKRSFFFDSIEPVAEAVAAFNADDPVGEEMMHSYTGARVGFTANGAPGCAYTAREVRLRPDGTTFQLVADGKSTVVSSRLIGSFNVTNMLAAAAICHRLGREMPVIADALNHVSPISGRFERIEAGQPFLVVVDYAHTPDALTKVLRTARQLTTGDLITVFGCGGNRDKTKRAPMGRSAGAHSDYAILTTDNPRDEDPADIARMAEDGLAESGMRRGCYQTVLDRTHAIERALTLAKPGDCVVIAGKGHETYQEIQGRKFTYDDRVVARDILRTLSSAWTSRPAATESAPARSM
ncbi:UDP-N-acetylmuramoyl-L-alanyl-D-glutamate--2,6-diaminopimelate ligase [Candidatus Poribacteria bacterium]|nr:UDP-N-acetylmuramoyl-L-alanyl-D-glutamate--2,6-diaminopimelate ligase [Candidatus Poribacteria bacterium]